jgi:hypothetical protein
LRTPPRTARPAVAAGARARRRKGTLAGLALLAALAALLPACSRRADTNADAGGRANANAEAATPARTPAEGAAAQDVSKIADRGDFKVTPRGSEDGGLSAEERAELDEEEKSLAEAAAELNKAFALPHDIFVGFDECDEPNAFYDTEKKEVVLCYQFVEDLYESLRGDFRSDEEIKEIVANATTFVFFHEVGHALIDAYDLPVTGREEDAVDQLSVVVLADGSEEGDRTVLDAARSFSRATDAALDELAYADEHSLDRQRFYNIICLLYGQNQEKFAALVNDGTLPEGRAERCGAEYARAKKAWDVLLAPYRK